MLQECVWTRCQRLAFPNSSGGHGEARVCQPPLASLPTTFSLPLFVHSSEADSFCVSDEQGGRVQCCEDEVYEAVDHRLFWLSVPAVSRVLPASKNAFCLYTRPEEAGLPVQLGCPEEVLLLADFFRDGPEDLLARWELRAQSQTARSRLSLSPHGGGSGLPLGGSTGQALWLDTAAGHVALHRSPPAPVDAIGRLHVRAHFYDDGECHTSMGHWLGCQSKFGKGAVGLALGIDDCYSFLHGDCPSGKRGEYHGWQRGTTPRSKGWHLLELEWEGSSLSICVDGEPLSIGAREGFSENAEVSVVSRCGGIGGWAGVEMFHTPAGQKTWGMGVQNVQPSTWLPWKVQGSEDGRWQLDDHGIMRALQFHSGMKVRVVPEKERLVQAFSRVPYDYFPRMDEMLGKEYEVLSVLPNGMVALPSVDGSNNGEWLFPPMTLLIVEPASLQLVEQELREEPARDLSMEPAVEVPVGLEAQAPQEEQAQVEAPAPPAHPSLGGLAIECWSLPNEADLERMERVMATFVEALQNAGQIVPSNVHRIEQCSAPQHPGCYVYSFGTRRVHVATRQTEAGRLLLVVRCGGGFIDFVEFVRRHGHLEHLRLRRRTDAQGREVMRLTSVLAKGKVKVQESRPSTSPCKLGNSTLAY